MQYKKDSHEKFRCLIIGGGCPAALSNVSWLLLNVN